jgi:hypothetical protein
VITVVLALSCFILLKSCSYYPLPDENSQRVTSPNGALDAVLICEGYGGAVGSVYWFVYVVPRGQSAPLGPEKAVFEAVDIEGAKLAWNNSNLLELEYNRAGTTPIRKTWNVNQVENAAWFGERRCSIEVRLASPPSN